MTPSFPLLLVWGFVTRYVQGTVPTRGGRADHTYDTTVMLTMNNFISVQASDNNLHQSAAETMGSEALDFGAAEARDEVHHDVRHRAADEVRNEVTSLLAADIRNVGSLLQETPSAVDEKAGLEDSSYYFYNTGGLDGSAPLDSLQRGGLDAPSSSAPAQQNVFSWLPPGQFAAAEISNVTNGTNATNTSNATTDEIVDAYKQSLVPGR